MYIGICNSVESGASGNGVRGLVCAPFPCSWKLVMGHKVWGPHVKLGHKRFSFWDCMSELYLCRSISTVNTYNLTTMVCCRTVPDNWAASTIAQF